MDTEHNLSSYVRGDAYRSPANYDFTNVIKQLFGLCARIGFKQSTNFILRFVCRPRYFANWFRFVSDFSKKHGLGRASDELLRKKTYRFFARGLPRNRGHKLLADHFNLAQSILSRDILESMWKGLPVEIGTVVCRRESYALSLHLSDHCGLHCEGGFSIRLTRQRDLFDLVKLGFIFYGLDDGAYTVAIGGIQGSNKKEAKRVVIDSTRDMDGLRPKDAVTLVMEGLAIGAGVNHFFAVSNVRHSINFRPCKDRFRKFADLDLYWIDRGGKSGGEFGFVLQVKNHLLQSSLSRRDMRKIEFLEFGKSLLVK